MQLFVNIIAFGVSSDNNNGSDSSDSIISSTSGISLQNSFNMVMTGEIQNYENQIQKKITKFMSKYDNKKEGKMHFISSWSSSVFDTNQNQNQHQHQNRNAIN